jgi:hypothetical protein
MKQDWKQVLKGVFNGVRILEKSKAEVLANFEQFCEFIFEPAFEALADEIDSYDVSAKIQKVKGREARISLSFPGSKEEQFRYRLILPRNSIDLILTLTIEGRKDKRSDFRSESEKFMPGMKTADILKLDKEDIMLDIIGRYRNVVYESLTSAD